MRSAEPIREELPGGGVSELIRLEPDGTPLQGDAWHLAGARALGCLIGQPGRAHAPLLLLVNAGVAQVAATPPVYKPTKRGGGGALKLLFWQGPTLLNPHFAPGAKDTEGCRLFHEPLAAWDADANLQPVLAAEIPSRENGGVAADGKSVIWKLKKGVTWHDGAPFTADDVVFNWLYAIDPATAATTIGAYQGMKVEKVDSHTVRVVFDKPTPFWPQSFATVNLIPKHLHGPYIGAKSREAPANLKPVGTGPYKFTDFKPGDLLRGELREGGVEELPVLAESLDDAADVFVLLGGQADHEVELQRGVARREGGVDRGLAAEAVVEALFAVGLELRAVGFVGEGVGDAFVGVRDRFLFGAADREDGRQQGEGEGEGTHGGRIKKVFKIPFYGKTETSVCRVD